MKGCCIRRYRILSINVDFCARSDVRCCQVETAIESEVGKSLVGNMIYNQDSNADSCKSPFKTGNTAASVTKASSMQYHSLFKSVVLDTVGVGDPELENDEILGNVRNLVRNASKGVNAVVVVMKSSGSAMLLGPTCMY